MNANTLSSVICPATITCLKVENSYSLYFSIEVFFFSGAFFLKSNKVVEKEVSEFLINCEVYNKFRRSIQNGFKNSFRNFQKMCPNFQDLAISSSKKHAQTTTSLKLKWVLDDLFPKSTAFPSDCSWINQQIYMIIMPFSTCEVYL